MKEVTSDYVILGGGLAGLSLCANLKSNSIQVIEKLEEPGGLIRSIKVDNFWFDAVVHLLHFQDDKDKNNLSEYISEEFTPIVQKANVVTDAGRTRFPFQLNLGDLPKDTASKCVSDYLEITENQPEKIGDFKEWLKQSFGKEMCEVFFYPYNSKLWKRPLHSIAPREINWTIQKFNSQKIVDGLKPDNYNNEAYNLNSLYPIPEKREEKRCMGILTDNIYHTIKSKVRLEEEIIEVNSEERYVISKTKEQNLIKYYYKKACISTIPLPELVKVSTPRIEKSYNFKSTGVIYAMVMLKGTKFNNSELSTYYASPEYVFSRIIYMQNFDPLTAPEGCWSLMAEITYNEEQNFNLDELESTIKSNLLQLEVVEKEDDFIKIHFEVHPYAYAVFEKNTKEGVDDLSSFYEDKDIHLLGRYGKWQYISMAQGYTEALDLATYFNTCN